MRIYHVILAIVLLPLGVLAQSTISGIINTYHKVIEVIPANSCVRLDNTSGLAPGDVVLIIQMKGATVSTTNNSSFGSITSLNNAGNYEVSTICSVQDDLVCLLTQLVRSYTVEDKVQLIKIPQYVSATVTDTLKAMPWDSATGKGGVLAFSVSNTLALNAPISANGVGYKGGAYIISGTNCSNFFPASSYVYNATFTNPQSGAYKGEGIATLATNQSGGKGAAANGGGGGNNHNNGGAGGSQLVTGGVGGGNSSAAGCTVSHPGIGGYALSSSGGARIYMGGGGGAGHANQVGFISTGGGAGGGIILFHAGSLISNGYKIMANGSEGGSTTGDGASGGGAGGTIILDVDNYSDALNAEVKGGDGGDINDDWIDQRCYGEGGGGSGGSVYFKTAIPTGTVTLSGGSKGTRSNSLNCAAIVASGNGSNGTTIINYNFTRSTTLSTYCSVSLDVQLLKFNVKPAGNNITIDWQVDHIEEVKEFLIERKKDGGTWNTIHTVKAAPSIGSYTHTDSRVEHGTYHYRLRIIEITGGESYSVVRSIQIGSSRISLYPNPASDFITISYPFKAGTKMKILNSLGETLSTKEFHRAESFFKQNISSFKSGVYYVIIDRHSISFTIQ